MYLYYKQKIILKLNQGHLKTIELGFSAVNDEPDLIRCLHLMEFIKAYFLQEIPTAIVKVDLNELILASTLMTPFIDRLHHTTDLSLPESLALELVKLMRMALDQVAAEKQAQAEGVH